MFSPTLPGLAKGQAEAVSSTSMGHTKLPSISHLGLVPSPPPTPIVPRADAFLHDRQLVIRPAADGNPACVVGAVSNLAASSSFIDRDSPSSHAVGPGWPLSFPTEQKLPPISDLLREVPSLLIHSQSCPDLRLTPLPSPIGPAPSAFSTPYPTWTTFPPRRRSFSCHLPGLLLPRPTTQGPRRASAPCLKPMPGPFTISGTSSTSHRAVLSDRDRERQRRQSKHVHRRRGSPFSSGSCFSSSSRHSKTQSSESDSDISTTPSSIITLSSSFCSQPETRTTAATTNLGTPREGGYWGRRKRNNKPYTFEQEAFFIYHRIDLEQTWEQVRAAFMARWPGLERSVSGLECAYYRTNLHLPATTGDGLLVLVDPSEILGEGHEQEGNNNDVVDGGGGDDEQQNEQGQQQQQQQQRKENKEPGMGYKFYRGAAYRTLAVKCRKARISLMERFPEELVDEANDWVREEHRVLARVAAEKRRLQREAFLAARATRPDCRLKVYY
ncbi:uncharacterized protein B0T15DRAFT_541965 [Chaetomium strumarium]|uniref:Uncharacterized protein n=1 Tax=Chaetomium strumarium TaxID=1170767 RepID=A0AAJ0LYB4_9PEZI|nr:hypothetical protein B0T15DRAFT_541965 [Chaetomium strumarium]